MRLRLLRRRLTISAPRMAVRSALPWPFRWALLAIVFGFCAAIGLWAFEFGKDIAGLERGSKDELVRLQGQISEIQSELLKTRDERDQAQSDLTVKRQAKACYPGPRRARGRRRVGVASKGATRF